MSHPNSSHDEQSEYPSDNYKPVRKEFKGAKSKALDKIKGFGSEYPGRKGIKKLLKKSISHRIKHF